MCACVFVWKERLNYVSYETYTQNNPEVTLFYLACSFTVEQMFYP